MNNIFDKFAKKVSSALGRSWAFIVALIAILIWLVMGPMTKFDDTWQLWCNTATTVITFLFVFILQNTMNRDNLAMNAKLDSLIKHSKAENSLQKLEDKTEEEIKRKRGN